MDLEELKLNEILLMRKDIKLRAIKLLIESIAEDAAYEAVSNLETAKEVEKYKVNK